MPRATVSRHLQPIAERALDLADYWEHRRLLEPAARLDPALIRRIVAIGLDHDEPDVREAAEDFRR